MLLTGGRLVKVDGATAKVTKRRSTPHVALMGWRREPGSSGSPHQRAGCARWTKRPAPSWPAAPETRNGSGIAIVNGQPWIAGADGGLSIVDPGSLAVSTALAAPPGGTFEGGNYTIGTPGGAPSSRGRRTARPVGFGTRLHDRSGDRGRRAVDHLVRRAPGRIARLGGLSVRLVVGDRFRRRDRPAVRASDAIRTTRRATEIPPGPTPLARQQGSDEAASR